MKDPKSKIYLFVSVISLLAFLAFVLYLFSPTVNDFSVSDSVNDILITGKQYLSEDYSDSTHVQLLNILDVEAGAIDASIDNTVNVIGYAPLFLSATQSNNLEILSGTVFIKTEQLTAIKVGASTAFFLEPESSAIISSDLRSIIVLSGFGSYRSDVPVIKGESARWEVDKFNLISFDKNQFIDNADLYNVFYLLYQLEKLPVEYRYVIDEKNSL